MSERRESGCMTITTASLKGEVLSAAYTRS